MQESQRDIHSLPYMPQLDGLRAISVLAVLYTHYWPEPNWLLGIYWGGIGVRCFFVLSGFLITTILLRDLQAAPFRVVWRNFIIRRAFRLWPLMIVAVSVAALTGLQTVRDGLLWHLLYLSNFFFVQAPDWKSVGYGAHLWSLSVEEQFYLLWPFVLFLLPRKAMPYVFAAMVPVAVIFWYAVDSTGYHVAADALLPASFDGLGCGALLAVISKERRLIAGIALAGICIYLLLGSDLITMGASMVFVWVVAKAANGELPLLANPVLRYIGVISYGIYVLHAFVIGWLWQLGLPLNQNAMAVAAIAATIGLASLSWHFFERPFIRMGHSLRKPAYELAT
jgi:peptidoglycan/LPS O-acetylase OafA/YrhL